MKALKKLNISGIMMQTAGNIGGAYATAIITNTLVPKVLPNADGKTANLVAFGAGVLLPALLAGRKKNPMIEDVAAGIRSMAGIQLLKEFVPSLPGISGIGTVENNVFPINDRINSPYGYYDEGDIYDSSVAGSIGAGVPLDMLNSPAGVASPVF